VVELYQQKHYLTSLLSAIKLNEKELLKAIFLSIPEEKLLLISQVFPRGKVG